MEHTEKKDTANSYKSILKGTSLLGGVQLFQIGVNLIRGKFVAMFLGPAGMGISSLFNSSSQTLQQIGSLGLNLGIVKEVASTKSSEEGLGHLYAAVRTLLIFTSLLGGLLCVVLAMPLSRFTFGSDAYYWQFVLLGAMVFFGIAGQGYLSILQGMHKVKLVSATTITGATTGLIIGVPLYYFWGTKGIVPAMVALTFSMFVAACIGVRKTMQNRQKIKFDRILHRPIVKHLIILGCVLAASDIINTGCLYLTSLFIRTFGHLENVGLYQAANSVTNQYSGVVFTAMMLDFFPRLSEAAKDNEKVRFLVNRQFEIVSLIASPLLCLLILSSPLIISILLTDEFMPIVPLMRWLGLGVMIKALMYPMGCIALSKDNRRLYFWMEGVFLNLLTLFLNCLGYYFFGLIGLGYSLIVDCLICIVVYYIVNRRLYGYRFTGEAFGQGVGALLLCGGCFACSFIANVALAYGLMSAVTLLAIIRSVVILRRRLR